MRIVTATTHSSIHGAAPRGSSPGLNLELAGLLAASAVILFGVALTYSGRLAQLERDNRQGRILELHRLQAATELAPLLTMFDDPAERQAVARAIQQRAADVERPLRHVGGLAEATIPAADIRSHPHYPVLRARLERRPSLTDVPVLTVTDIANLKPSLAVRTLADYRAALGRAVLWFLGAFWAAHALRRLRRADDDPLVLPLLLMLSGLGMMTMLALRDPLRDTLTVSLFVSGVVAGIVLLLGASELDFEASRLRRAVLTPLGLALVLATLLLIFGKGPGSSGVKVNLFGVQPVEGIRLLVVFALAALFARRLDVLRELSEPPTSARPWLRYVRVPRWRDVRPVVASMAMVLAFFFLQKDLGPALVLSCVFLAMYGVARGRTGFVIVGFAMLFAGFTAAYWLGYPATVRQRVMIWADPWNNGVAGGNQVAHGLWALATGALWGSGPGLGTPQSIPAGHTDFVIAAIGEELGFIGLVVVVGLYTLLSWRCLRVAARAPGDYTAFLAIGVALVLVVQAFVISSGLLGLVPLSGVVTPFLSYGRSSMLANFLAVGVVLAIARRQGPVRRHLVVPIRSLATVLTAAAVLVVGRASWVQVVRADEIAAASSLSEQADGGYRFEYNPRLVSASRLIVRGTIFDRHGVPLATSRPEQMKTLAATYKQAGIVPEQDCVADTVRCYPLAGVAFSVLGDWTHQTNWGARNSSYVERDSDSRLKGFDDRQQVVDVINPRTGAQDRAARRDYSELLPLVRNRHYLDSRPVQALFARQRDLHSSIDARLQVRVAAALRKRIEAGGHARGAAVVLDVDSGEVLASVSYPWPAQPDLERGPSAAASDDDMAWTLDRARYGLYPPGSTFKLLVAAAALRSSGVNHEHTFACIRLSDGRVGNFVRGATRPVRDDPLDTAPHGAVGLRQGLVVSCNAYFAQLAQRLGPRPILDAASLFQIAAASPATPESLQRTLPHAGYGQAEVVVSPLKMARLAAAIAARGVVRPVRWTAVAEPTAAPEHQFLSAADATLLSRYMREVVTNGTGRILASNATPIAGKTGTAEVGDGPAHSWFAGFAPFSGPRKIAFAVLIENAGYGARAAAPVAGEIVTAAREIGLFK